MTEPRVEAGDRALETARKIAQSQADFDDDCNPLPVAEIAALIQSAMNAQDKERLGTDWQELAEKNQETADKALALVDAMNAQERELREALKHATSCANPDCDKCLELHRGLLLAERGEGR